MPHLRPDAFANTLRPIRQPRDRLILNKEECLNRSLSLATSKLRQIDAQPAASLILVLCDADEDCAKVLAEKMQKIATANSFLYAVSTVLAVREYETWFVGAASSLERFLNLTSAIPVDPEQSGHKKRWIEDRFRGTRYSETIDQPRMTAEMDLDLCRDHCPSFDKLCRDIEGVLNLADHT